MTGQEIYLIEMTVYDPDIAGTRVLRFSTGTGMTTRPGETPANAYYEPRVIDAGSFAKYLIDVLATEGNTRVGFGSVTLNNADGALDGLLEFGFDGRPVVIRRGKQGGAYPADFPVQLTATMEQIEPTLNTVTVLMRDRQAEASAKPYQSAKFAGNNALPNGVEGIADDLKDKPKPILRGKCRNVAPPLVNTSKLTYQVSSLALQSLDAVYVGGNAVTAGSAHASLAALQAASPAGGQFDYYLGSGGDGAFFRLGTTPSAAVTCDATQGATSADRTAAQIARAILLAAGIPSGDIDAAKVAALDAANPAVVGFYSGQEELSVGVAVDAVLRGIGGYWAVGSTGLFEFGRLEEPSGTPACTFRRWELVSGGGEPVERIAARGDARLPSYRINLGYQRNWTVMGDADVVSAVTQARRNFLKSELRTTNAADNSVLTAHPLAGEKAVETLLDDATAAATEAARLLDMYKVRRDTLRIRVSTGHVAAIELALGQVVALEFERYDWAGKLFRIIGIGREFSADVTVLDLWG